MTEEWRNSTSFFFPLVPSLPPSFLPSFLSPSFPLTLIFLRPTFVPPSLLPSFLPHPHPSLHPSIAPFFLLPHLFLHVFTYVPVAFTAAMMSWTLPDPTYVLELAEYNLESRCDKYIVSTYVYVCVCVCVAEGTIQSEERVHVNSCTVLFCTLRHFSFTILNIHRRKTISTEISASQRAFEEFYFAVEITENKSYK